MHPDSRQCTAILIPYSAKVTSSECSRDGPFIVFEGPLEHEEDCRTLCQTYANIPALGGCTFAAWKAGSVLGTCLLYNEPFADYIANCFLLAGSIVDDPRHI